MNWLGKLVQKEIKRSDTVLDIGCGIMAPTLDTCPTYPRSKLKCNHITGVDIHRRYLEYLKDRKNITCINTSVPDGLRIFVDNSFDVVIMLDVIEHMIIDLSMCLISEAERIARKKVIVFTPSYFYQNEHHNKEHYPYTGLGDNEYFEHKCFFDPDQLKQLGYHVTFPPPDRNTFGVKVVCNHS